MPLEPQGVQDAGGNSVNYYEHNAGRPELDTVEYETPPDAEANALRVALLRLQQDVYALQRALSRSTEERDQWREAYHRVLRERAEWTTTIPARHGPPTN